MRARPNIFRVMGAVGVAACGMMCASAAAQPSDRVVDRTEYEARLRAMWLGEAIANWTGLMAEGQRQAPPFLTDADWGTSPFPEKPWVTLQLNLYSNPWHADDDTDIEYVYVHLLHTLGASRLTGEQIAAGWRAHINRLIWVSNANARNLMERGIVPPMTALAQGLAGDVVPKVDQSLMIDAQLTTEIFGALCPGMPERALAIADLPIATTAHGYAVHAAQYYAVLYALATRSDPSMTGPQRAEWLARQARKYIPDSSKAADMVDFVLADYVANPDKQDWERTRDLVYQRYVADAAAHGFVYRVWYESGVNFALGIVTLLYGGMDFEKTVRIGTLAGFDADNQAATMGGLVALAQGQQFLATYGWCSDRYRWESTRDGLVDYLPEDPMAGDTFTLLAARMMPLVDREVVEGGGRVGVTQWVLPAAGYGSGVSASATLSGSPTARRDAASANNRVVRAGGSASAATNVPGTPGAAFGSADIGLIANGYEHDFRGLEDDGTRRGFVSTQRAIGTPGVPGEHAFEVMYSAPVNVERVRFIGGDIFTSGAVTGGWYQNVRLEVRVGGAWVSAVLKGETPTPSANEPFQIMEFVLSAPVMASGVRVVGTPGGAGSEGGGFVTCCELDAMAPEVSGTPSLDVDGDGVVGVEDVYAWYAQGRDLDGDGDVDCEDEAYLLSVLRFGEAGGMAGR